MSRMARYWWRWCGQVVALGSGLVLGGALAKLPALAGFASSGDYVLAQIVPDRTLPNNSSVSSQDNIRTISGGTQTGSNLFHSFEEFSVPTGTAAYFNNAMDIQNILTRVTGSSISNIDGLIRANGTTNLFLLNPNGIIFGGNAQLNIGGSFVASTASNLVFADGTVFSAKPAIPTTPLLTISVPIGLQYESNPGSVQVRGSSLQVAPGKTLAVVGGNVSLEGGQLLAPGGRVELGGVAGESTVGLSANGEYLGLSFPQQVPLSDVSLTNGAKVNVLAGSGGSVAVNAMNLNMAGGSSLQAGIDEGIGSVSSVAGDIEVNATGAINLSDASLIFNHVQPNAVGNGGDITITTRSLLATGGSQVRTTTYAQGNAGSVRITASDTVTFDGVDSNGSPSAARSLVRAGGVGNSGGVTINTGSLFVTNGADLNASVTRQARGTGGGITINARDSVSFNGGFARSRLEKDGVGRAGDIHINTGSLLLTGIPKDVADANIGQVVAATFGQGDAGSVIINARNAVTIDGKGSEIWTIVAKDRGVGNAGDITINSGSLSLTGGARLVSSVENLGNAGDITITTGSLSLTNGGAFNSSTYGQGNAGNVTINARNTVSLNGTAGGDGFLRSGVFSSVAPGSLGSAGNITITTGSLFVTNDARVAADTQGQGDAANITIQARDNVSFDGGNAFSTVADGAVGNGGNIDITSRSLTVTNGSKLLTLTRGQGDAGNIILNTTDSVTLSGSDPSFDTRLAPFDRLILDPASPDSGLFANNVNSPSQGGDIRITTGQLTVRDSAQVTVSSTGSGGAGNIEVSAQAILLDNQASISADTTGGQGNINLQIGDLILRHNSNITTNATGTVTGGNITINTDNLVAVPKENSDISANAQESFGGRVIVNASGIFGTQFRDAPTPLSDITATSELSPQFNGIVELNTPDIDPNQGFINLPTAPVDTQVSQVCQAGTRQNQNSFIITGRGGLPPNPRQFLRSQAVQVDWVTLDAGANNPTGDVQSRETQRRVSGGLYSQIGNNVNTKTTEIVEAQGWVVDANGKIVLVATAPTATPHSSWQTPADCRTVESTK